MAMKSLTIENFLGKTITHQFYKKNRIKGPNGSGKTTIKQAICFLFSGTDSAGSRNPQHLISNDKDATKVTIETDKSTIVRTLTKKGNGTIKVSVGDVTNTLTQTELENALCSSDLFLSAFVPGYFLSLPIEKQHRIISEISPKTDRHILVEEISGLTLTAEEKMRYAFTRKADTVGMALAKDRLDYERQVSGKEGEIKQLTSITALPQPVKPSGLERIPYLINLQKQWDNYSTAVSIYNANSSRFERIKSENDIRARRRTDLQGQLDSIALSDIVPVTPRATDITALRLQKKPEPPRPSVGNIIEADHCPTCGQTVGVKHRESVKNKNNELMSCYEQELNVVKGFNSEIDKQIQALVDAEALDLRVFNQATQQNEKLKTQRQSLKIEIASLSDQELPDNVVVKPDAPSEVFNQQELSDLQRIERNHEGDVSKYNFVNDQIAAAASKIEGLKNGIENLRAAITRISKLEDAMSVVPQRELQIQLQAFQMETVQIAISDVIEVRKDGILYEYLSTGQAAKADLEISRKINSLMPRKVNAIFLDNADLVDVLDWGDTQMFAAYVDPSIDHVQIEEIQ